MVAIKPLTQITQEDLKRLIRGYSSDRRYVVRHSDGEISTSFEIHLSRLEVPYRKRFTYLDPETMEYCAGVITQKFSFGAFDQQHLVGMLIAEPRRWNKDLWVWELHVAEPYQRRGIGGQLVKAAVHKAETAGLRSITCETQNTNVNAIHFYRKQGFKIEGIDISYYSNDDYPDGEVAIFMRYRLSPSKDLHHAA